MNPKALLNLTCGIYRLSAHEDGRDNACLINTAVQVANNPTRISVAVIKGGLTHDMIARTGVCTLSAVTTEAEFSLFTLFGMQSGRDLDKFAQYPETARAENGCLYLTKWANTYLSLRITDTFDLGSHTLFIGELTDGDVISSVPCCTYGYYQTKIKPQVNAPKSDKKQWRCTLCGYIHEGDELPEDIVCPLCKHGVEAFEEVKPSRRWECQVCSYVYEGSELPEDFLCPLCKHGVEEFVLLDDEPAAPTGSGKQFVCEVCGYVHEGDALPEGFVCPLCGATADQFAERNTSEGLIWAAEHVVGAAKGAEEALMEGLRQNFTGECTEVGMYLAMARVAHREGYPEIGRYWEKAAWEEAEHAAKFAELLGEVVTDSTKKNLELRAAAENGATQGKFELAKLAKEKNLDAIHDTVHEMARDEARHGKAFEGFLKRYFGK